MIEGSNINREEGQPGIVRCKITSLFTIKYLAKETRVHTQLLNPSCKSGSSLGASLLLTIAQRLKNYSAPSHHNAQFRLRIVK
jgi:hypothetical protein